MIARTKKSKREYRFYKRPYLMTPAVALVFDVLLEDVQEPTNSWDYWEGMDAMPRPMRTEQLRGERLG